MPLRLLRHLRKVAAEMAAVVGDAPMQRLFSGDTCTQGGERVGPRLHGLEVAAGSAEVRRDELVGEEVWEGRTG